MFNDIYINKKSLALWVGLFLFISNIFSQRQFNTNSIDQVGNINITPIHSLGIFSSRINQSFRLKAVDKLSFQIDLGTGNIWAPPTTTFIPKHKDDRELVSQTVWHERDNPSLRGLNSDSSFYFADAVIKTFIPSIKIPFTQKAELQFSLRTFLVTEGTFPFATITSDQFIETFHKNIKGGNDPFGRKDYGYNQAHIQYKDKNGRSLHLTKNDFVVAGFSTDYFYYTNSKLPLIGPIYMNLGGHLGVNTTKVNPSLDLGISQTTLKEISLNERSLLLVGVGFNLLRKNVINYGEVVELTSNSYLFNFNFQPKFLKKTKSGRIYSLAFNYYYQSPYNKRKEFDESIISGEKVTSHWHLGTSHLYESLEVYTLMLSLSEKNTLSLYLQQDFKVNNNSDLQTGISYSLNIN